MKPFRAAGRWLSSLSGRITIFVILALVIAQILGIAVFARGHEKEQGELRTEGVMRQIASITTLFNSVDGIDRRGYLRSLASPGSVFQIGRTPTVEASTPIPDYQSLPNNWRAVTSPDKRLAYFPDTRDWSMRLSIAPVPLQRNLGRPPDRGPPPEPLTPQQAEDMAEDMPPDGGEGGPGPGGLAPPEPGPGGPPGREPRGPGGPGGPGPNGPGFNGPGFNGPGFNGPGGNDGPPRFGRPPARWRASVQLANGEWLNAEQMYELGLAPWLSTVLYENSVILALMVLFIVPVVTFSTRRLTQLARAADRLGRGEDAEALPESGTSEILHLTQAFNAMSLRLRRFVQGRTQMLAGISHDLRTPITALRLRTDLVDDDENRERMQALIDDMHHLTEATLTLAKDESFTEKTDKVDLSALIEGICDDLQDAHIDATADVQRGVSLVCRPFSLRRAIRNVTENGAKYGKRSRISLKDAADAVSIIVDDDGPGIPESEMERAFQPFVRLEGSRSRETGGSGLGLAITRSIVLNHGGDIALTNRPEGGLRVTITLPKGIEP